jgi:hypothetical protein
MYLLSVGVLDWLAYRRYNQRWKRRERARTVIGVLVVLLPGMALGVVGVLDMWTLLTIFFGFGVAGLVTLAADIEGETSAAAQLREGFQDAESNL